MTDGLLHVWLAGQHLGMLARLRSGRMRLRFDTEAVNRLGVGSRALSLSLPVTPNRVEGSALDRYLEGLLPESPLRQSLERDHGVRPGDVFALLSAIGQECAGAIQFTREDAAPGPGELRPMTTEEVSRLVRDLPTLSSPDGLPVTASLGGVQTKVLLTRTDRGWAWPTFGAISTHIVKPDPATGIAIPGLIHAEEWTLRLARSVGIRAASAAIEDFDGRAAIVVERYDRLGGVRSHQEDFTQALGFAPAEKYEASPAGQRRLHRIAVEAGALARDEAAFLRDLLRAVAFNLIIGNGDAHSKNYSLLIDHRSGTFALSPLYDAAPVFLLNRAVSSAGHVLNGQVDLKYLTLQHAITEAAQWGLPFDEARDLVIGLATAIAETATRVDAGDEIAGLPSLMSDRAAELLELL